MLNAQCLKRTVYGLFNKFRAFRDGKLKFAVRTVAAGSMKSLKGFRYILKKVAASIHLENC